MANNQKQPDSEVELTSRLKQHAIALGFPLVGVAKASRPERLPQFWKWLDNGFAGRMQYLERRREAYSHPASVLEGCDSLLMLGAPYLTSSQQKPAAICPSGSGKVARYAQSGVDYHNVIRRRLKELKRWLIGQAPEAKVRGVVDTAPILEREFAEMAGLGWIGKNTLLLNQQWGSYFFLAALLTDYPLEPDAAHETNHCGTCTACLDHCPTQAFPQPFVLDARRCISYLTIEQSDAVDPSLANQMNGWIFGCDVCQEVCPWNRKSRIAMDSTWQPQSTFRTLDILEILQMNSDQFERTYRQTPLWRSGHHGMIRNAILVAGWHRSKEATESLLGLLSSDSELLRATAAWALGRIGGKSVLKVLEISLASETATEVREAMVRSINELSQSAAEP